MLELHSLPLCALDFCTIDYTRLVRSLHSSAGVQRLSCYLCSDSACGHTIDTGRCGAVRSSVFAVHDIGTL
jgi:hypothetical protein